MAKQLLKDNFTPTTFEIDGVKFIECDYEKEFTIRMDNIARKIMIKFALLNQNPSLEDLENAFVSHEILALCTKEQGTKWDVEQYEKNKEFFLDNPFPSEGAKIFQNFFSLTEKLVSRGFQTSSLKTALKK
jgi:hypothetical protein